MNVCVLAPFEVIPPKSGAARRVFEISLGLCNAGIQVVLLHAGASQLCEAGLRLVGFPALENLSLTKHFLWSRPLDAYLSSLNFALYKTLIHVVRNLKIDILQIEGPWSIFPAQLAHIVAGEVPLVYDAHNVEISSTKYSSSVGWMWPFAAWLEKEAVTHSDAVFCVSELDKARMCSSYGLPLERAYVIPNGVRKYRCRTDAAQQIRRKLGLQMNTKIVFFHGALRWKPNLDAAWSIVKSIAKDFGEDGETVFLIAGSDPPRKLLEKACGRRNVRILGYVPRVQEWICGADVCIAPLRTGSGTRLKILEYLAAGKPIVATHKAVEGIEVEQGVDALVFDDIGEEFVQGIKSALTPELSRKLGERANALVERFEWSTIAKQISKVYEIVLNQHRN